MFSDARFQSKTNEKLLCLLEHVSIDVFKLRLGLYGWNRRIWRASLKKSWKYTAKNVISRGLGPSKKKCLQTCRNFLKSSNMFIHITKHILWRFEEDRLRFAFRATDGRTWSHVKFSLEKRIFVCITTCAALVFTRLCLHQEVAFEHISQTSPGVRM